MPDGDLRQLFREAAKRMHPDLVRHAAGRAHAEAFMKRLNAAYRAVDAAAIRDLLLQWSASPYAPATAAGGAPRRARGLNDTSGRRATLRLPGAGERGWGARCPGAMARPTNAD